VEEAEPLSKKPLLGGDGGGLDGQGCRVDFSTSAAVVNGMNMLGVAGGAGGGLTAPGGKRTVPSRPAESKEGDAAQEGCAGGRHRKKRASER